MASLTPLFAAITPGAHNMEVWFLLGWKTIGSCTVTASGPFDFAADGSYDALGRQGPFSLTLSLTDRDPAAAFGPCTVTLNGQAGTGSYLQQGDELTFADAHNKVVCSPDSDGVIFEVQGYPKFRLRA